MHALIVVAHPDPNSLSHGVAQALAGGVSGAGHSVEIADLAREGFDPRFSLNDLSVPPPRDRPAGRHRLRAGAGRPGRCAGAGLSDLLVVDAGADEGLDRPRLRQWLGL